MAVTRLIRKTRKNRARSNNRIQNIAQFTKQPVVKAVDPEELKKEFEAAPAEKKATKKAAKPKAEVAPEAPVAEKQEEAPAAEETKTEE